MTKIFTRLTLLLALLVAGVGSVCAKKVYADLSKLSNGPVSTWDGATSTMTWTGTSNNMISNFDFPIGNYREYQTISVTVSDLTNAVGLRLQIKANGQEKLVALNGNGTFTKYLIDDFGFTSSDLTKVEWVRLLGSAWQNGESNTIDAEHPASAVISDVYLEQPMRTLNVDLGKMAATNGNATWSSGNGTFAWTGTWSNAIALPGLTGNLASFKAVNYETAAGTSDHFRIIIYYTNGAGQTTYQASVGNKSVSFADMGVSAANLPYVSSINIAGASDVNGDIILNSFSLEGPLVNIIETSTTQLAPEGVTDINGMTDVSSAKWSIAYPLTVGDGTQFGGNIDRDNVSVDISAYDYLLFVVSDASNDAKTGLRVFVSTANSENNTTRVILYPHPIAEYTSVSDWTAQSFITAAGIYVVKISDYPLLRGMKNLAYWQGSAGTAVVSQAYLGSGTPVAPSESTVVTGTDALNDANAMCFDVTGLADAGVTYNPANPNALFIANAGTLTNTQNVIVDGTCANLVLTDEKPFRAPSAFTATAASLSKTVTNAEYATMVLPFAAAVPVGVEAYDITGETDGVLTTSQVESITANKPVMLKNAGTFTFTASGVAVAPTPTGAQQNGLLYGVYETTDVPTANGYVLQKQDTDVNFFKAVAGTKVNAFRAYLATSSPSARLAFDFETTGIKTAVQKTEAGAEVYNLNGQRVAQPRQGLYIVGGKKMMVK